MWACAAHTGEACVSTVSTACLHWHQCSKVFRETCAPLMQQVAADNAPFMCGIPAGTLQGARG